MKVNSIPQTSFKSYVPVALYARRNEDEQFKRVYYSKDNNYLSRCQKQVIRTLNGTHKNPNQQFLDFYKMFDKQYVEHPEARSIYDNKNSLVYLVTGFDVKALDNISREIGIAKAEEKAKNPNMQGKIKSPHVSAVANEYFRKAYAYLANYSRRLKDDNGKPLILKVYLDAKCDKKNNIKEFSIAGTKLVSDNERNYYC